MSKQFLLNLQIFKTAIMSYNVKDDKESFYQNLENLNKNISEKDYIYLKKIIKEQKSEFLKPIIELENFEPIIDKKIIYEKKFLELIHNIFEYIIYNIAFLLGNIGDFVKTIITNLNKIFIENYFLLDCSNLKDINSSVIKELSSYQYNCGRGFMQIEKGPSRFLIFNTNDDALLDIEIVNKYKDKDLSTEFSPIIFNVNFPVDEKNIKNTEEYKKFNNELEKIKEVENKGILLLKISKKIGYNTIYKIPFFLKYYSIGEFNKKEKHFSLGLYELNDSVITKYDLILENEKIQNLDFDEVIKKLNEKGLM